MRDAGRPGAGEEAGGRSTRPEVPVVELLYTVQVSFREHALVPEPFLLVGLIAGIRRVLVLTAEFGELRGRSELELRYFLLELGVLTLLVVALTVSLVLLRKSGQVSAKRA